MDSIKNLIIKTHPGISEGYAADLSHTWHEVYDNEIWAGRSVAAADKTAWGCIQYYLDDPAL